MPRPQVQNASQMRTLFIAICMLVVPFLFTSFYWTRGDTNSQHDFSTETEIPEVKLTQEVEIEKESQVFRITCLHSRFKQK